MTRVSVDLLNKPDYILEYCRRHALHLTSRFALMRLEDWRAVQESLSNSEAEGAESRSSLARRKVNVEANIHTLEIPAFVQHRREICQACPHMKQLHRVSVSCGKCGCSGLSLLSANSRCPDGSW